MILGYDCYAFMLNQDDDTLRMRVLLRCASSLAISVFLSLLLSNISQIIFIQYVKGYRLFYTFNYIIWIISIALFFCSWLMRNHLEVYSNYLLTIFCIVLFPIIIFILGIINKKDIKMFRIISLVK